MLNTCCIRENADNRLYGTLGHLKTLKAARPGMQIAVAGCLAQKDRELIQAGPPGWTSSSAPTTSAGPPTCCARRAPSGPVVEILEETALDEAEPSPRPCPSRRELAWPPG